MVKDMYVMVIENYFDEGYLGNVRAKESISNYKTRYWGYSKEVNEEELSELITHSEIVPWSAVIDLDKNEMLTNEEEFAIFNKYNSNKEIRLNDKWFFDQFNYNNKNA